MKWWCLTVLLLWPGWLAAQLVQVTEIAPHPLDGTPEWFEFRIDEGVPLETLQTWLVGNGTHTAKPIADLTDKLQTGADGYYVFSPAPFSLPNNGGRIVFYDADDSILHDIEYPKAQSSSPKAYEQREIWNWDDEYQQLLPQLVRAPLTPGFEASPNAPNLSLPTPPERYQIVINEASPDHTDTDFVEILVLDGPDKINLQYTELKHNGTTLWEQAAPLWVSPGDYLLFYIGTEDSGKVAPLTYHTNARSGLSGGSGTLELKTMVGTSHETTLDALCWKDQTLSQTEQKRVDKWRLEGQWQGACVDISSLVKNESLARFRPQDRHLASDFFRHFHGSPGAQNKTQNHPPTAKITVQGSGKTEGPISFYLNLSGEASSDPDGSADLKSYRWRLNEVVFADVKNPGGFYLETEGEHEIHLQVTDQSGESDDARLTIITYQGPKRSTANGAEMAKKKAAKALIETSVSPSNAPQQTPIFPEAWYVWEAPKPLPRQPNYEPALAKTRSYVNYRLDWQRRINLPNPVRARAKKNLGVLFSWRESPWPDLAAEWTAVVAADRRSGYFGGVYLGF